MSFVFGTLLIPLIISALLGLLVGWSTCATPVSRKGWNWATYGIVAFVAGLLVAGLALLPGRPGLGLEAAMMMFATYIAGCSLGCFLHNVSIGSVTAEPASSYTQRVAGIGTVSAPSKAETVPISSLPFLAEGVSRTMALKPSPNGYVMTVAAINTTAAEATLKARDAMLVRVNSNLGAKARTPETMALAAASINTIAGRNGVHDVLQRSKAQALFAAASRPEAHEVAGHAASHAVAPVRRAFPRHDAMALAVAAINTLADRSGVHDLFERSRADAAATSMPVAATSIAPVVEVHSAHADRPGGDKPMLLPEPRDGRKDDLTLIWGVAETLEAKLNGMGIWHFDQIAQWDVMHVQWFEATMEGFKGRIERDKWIEQCKRLSEGWRPDNAVGQRMKH